MKKLCCFKYGGSTLRGTVKGPEVMSRADKKRAAMTPPTPVVAAPLATVPETPAESKEATPLVIPAAAMAPAEGGAPKAEPQASAMGANPAPASVTEQPASAANPLDQAVVAKAVEDTVDLAQTLKQLGTTFDHFGRTLDQLQRVLASGYEGKRWIPKVGEAKADFVKRAQAGEPSFDVSVWASAHEKDLRSEHPGNFGGAGW